MSSALEDHETLFQTFLGEIKAEFTKLGQTTSWNHQYTKESERFIVSLQLEGDDPSYTSLHVLVMKEDGARVASHACFVDANVLKDHLEQLRFNEVDMTLFVPVFLDSLSKGVSIEGSELVFSYFLPSETDHGSTPKAVFDRFYSNIAESRQLNEECVKLRSERVELGQRNMSAIYIPALVEEGSAHLPPVAGRVNRGKRRTGRKRPRIE